MKIAWIGTGVMGKAMALHLADGGHNVTAYNRTYDKAKDLELHGIHVVQSIQDCVSDADVIFTMVGYPKDVQEIYTKKDGIFQCARAGAILIDMTTSSPSLAKHLYKEAKTHQMPLLDAPVSGGDQGARMASLSIMCGGDKEIYTACIPLFSLMGTSLNYMGGAGNGQHTKACNQIAVAGATAAMSEALVYAKKHELDPALMFEAIKNGAAGSWQINHMAPRILQGDFAPGFYIKHFIKDMKIIQNEMQNTGISLEMLNTICNMYEKFSVDYQEHNGTQALLHYYGD